MKGRFWSYMALYGLLIFSSIPLILGWVPPNRFYGFRIHSGLASSELWYDLNHRGGLLFLAAMVICLLVNLLTFWKGPQFFKEQLTWVNLVLILISFWLISVELLYYVS